MSVNAARGEVAFEAGGRSFTLCLTLGALAEIEAGLGLSGLDALEARLKQPRAADIAVLLGALIRGGGHDVADAELRAWPLDLAAATRAIAAAFRAAGLA